MAHKLLELPTLLHQLGQVGKHLAEMGAAEAAAGNLSVCLRETHNVSEYFPDEQGIRNKWEIALSKPELERIAKGEVTGLKLWACRTSACGCKFSSERRSCFYCDWIDVPASA